MGKFFDIQKINDITVVKFFRSEMTIEEIGEIREELYGIASSPAKPNFLLNMQKCVFIPSMMLGILVNFNAKVRAKGGKVALCCLTKEIQSLFAITKLSKVFEIYQTEVDGLGAFK